MNEPVIIATMSPDIIKAIAIVIAVFCVMAWSERDAWRDWHD